LQARGIHAVKERDIQLVFTREPQQLTCRQTVLVTGGTRGLGLAIAKLLADRGYRVVATGRKCPEDFPGHGTSDDIHYFEMDLRQHSDLHRCVGEIVKRYGPLFGLVNNAAIGWDGVLATMHDSQIEELIATNVTGTILVSKYAIRSMLINRRGRVVNISSIIASTGYNGLSVYAASKAAMNGFTRSLAREVGKAGITVNTVAPGYMQTDMTQAIDQEKLQTIRRRSPLGRLASVADAAGAVAWLLSDEASSITGTVITVDAGSTA
jgi:3-oxoacyl-[acyl-carrier protein] reductase